MTARTDIPAYSELLWTTLCAVRDTGDSATIREIVERVVEREGFSEGQQAVLHGEGPQTEIEYRLAWARTYLKGMGLLHNSDRGVWSTTETGRDVAEHQIPELHASYVQRLRDARRAKRVATTEDEGLDDGDWKQELLELLLSLDPSDFERLARRLLREAGFISATVTGRSGDGGIDGLGVYRLSLLSFPVFFQCKRYRGSVSAGAVRDFRGAMAGRGDKGLLITTGTFTKEARDEATRDGAPPIDLIDGSRLCDLLKDFRMGVDVRSRTVEEIQLHPEFFDDL